jgi:hypothetical protein
LDLNAGLSHGTFEIDTTCCDPTSHLLYIDHFADPIVPSFTKGTITVTCDCPDHGDADGDGFITSLDLALFIDCLFACDFPVADNPACPDPWSPFLSDWDCDGFPTALDLGMHIDYLFASGDGPCDPCACDPYPDNCP